MKRLIDMSKVQRVLCIGAHSDDIEIGCGGTILRMVGERPGIAVRWVVFSANPVREEEARNSAAGFLAGSASEIIIHHFRDAYFPHDPAIKEAVEALKGFNPD